MRWVDLDWTPPRRYARKLAVIGIVPVAQDRARDGVGGGVGDSPHANTPGSLQSNTGFIRGILRGVRYAKSLRVLFLHRRSPSWTTLVLYSRVVFIFNEATNRVSLAQERVMDGIGGAR